MNIEIATDEEIADTYYDWHCDMAHAFNGTPYPKDFPRDKSRRRFYEKGMHMAFYNLSDYVKAKHIKVKGL